MSCFGPCLQVILTLSLFPARDGPNDVNLRFFPCPPLWQVQWILDTTISGIPAILDMAIFSWQRDLVLAQ